MESLQDAGSGVFEEVTPEGEASFVPLLLPATDVVVV